jgi:hypothetical protein
MERRVRLGDVIDDYCTRCRMIMNHGIVGMVGDDVAKVRCNTCQSEHTYKHGRLPKRRRGETDRLFAEVLRGIRGEPDAGAESGEAQDEPEPEAASQGSRDAEQKDEARPARRVPRHARVAAAGRRAAARPHDDAAEPEDRDDAGEGEADAEPAPDSGEPESVERESSEPQREEEPAHGVRRKLFTIRRHSGGKPPVAGVTTDGSAERAARGQGTQQQPGGHGRFGGGRGGSGGGRHGQGGHGGGGRPDQQGRWPRRHRRRG